MTSRVSVIPASAGRLSWRSQVAEESSSWRLGPRSCPGPSWPVPRLWLACPRSFSYLCPSWLPPARRPDSGKLPVLTGTNQADAHTEIPAWSGMQTSSLCASQGAPTRHRRSMPCPARIGATFRCSRPAHGRAAPCQRGLMPLGQCMRRNDARGSAVCTGRAHARQGMMASTVFFSALGWAGDLGAFFRARSSLAPSSCSCLRPRPARTLGNQSCSSSSM